MQTPVRVLLVEDSEGDAALLLRALRGGGFDPVFERVDRADTMRAALDHQPWDAVISDHAMPQFSSGDALELLRERQLDIPFIIVSGTIDEETAVAAMKAGAHDYVPKERLARLVPALTRELTEAQSRSERRRAEELLRATEAQFRQAQKMEAIGRLAGGVAHDFNNLLTAILGYSELVLDHLDKDHPARADAMEIMRAGERAAALTRQLLTLSRQQILQPQVLDLNAAVKETRQLLSRLIGEDIRLKTALAPDLGRTKADPGQISQVIMNLAVNARDAMPDGGRLILETANVELDQEYVRRHVGCRPGPYVMLAVTDTGTGIAPDVADRIFEPFFTTKDTGKGTGLGLSTVYGIVEQSGGSIWVYSEQGKGTTFKVYLPRIDEIEAVESGRQERQGVVRGSGTILLADDEPAVRDLAHRVLARAGYDVLEAHDAQSALDVASRHDGVIDLLMTDVVMPGMNGRDLAARLAQSRPGIRVLYLSGYTDRSMVSVGALPEGAAFLQKPFTPTVLASKIRLLLDDCRSQGR